MLYRVPPHQIAAWPALSIHLLEHYLAKQPAPEERIEIALATLCALFYNANRGKSQRAMRASDFLPYRDPWPEPSEFSDLDREVFAAFGLRI